VSAAERMAADTLTEADAIATFCDALRQRGIIPPWYIVADGKLHRCDAEGGHGKGDAAYLLHLDGIPAGGFQNWRDAEGWEIWTANIGRSLTAAERNDLRQQAEIARAEREAEEAQRHAEAAARADAIWRDIPPCSEHPYLDRKGVRAHGVRLSRGNVVIPVRDAEGLLHSLQFIGEDGGKKFLFGGRIRGGYCAIGRPADVILVGEGYATCASAHEASGYPVAVAFDCGNLRAVAEALRAKFQSARIVLLADDDYLTVGNPGVTRAEEAAGAIGGVIAVPEFGSARPNGFKDFNDMVKFAGAAAVKEVIEAALAVKPEPFITGAAQSDPVPEIADFPVMAPEAFVGLAGDIVRMIEPHTESDPAGLLLSAHAFFGNCVGRGPHYLVESTQHGLNLFVLKVGDSSKARKGTGEGRVLSLFRNVDEEWASQRLHTGLSSGEGVIWEVRDQITKMVKEGKGAGASLVEEVVDHGVPDKRLLVIESEFSGALRVMQREGNILSRVLRDAWDRGDLATMTKNSPARATGAGISIIGHITAAELRECLDRTDMANGFANRFLFACVRRSKLLPFGGNLDDGELFSMAAQVRRAVERARAVRQVRMSPEAADGWVRIYSDLSADRPGLLGSLTARAEAQVVRLATIYALWEGGDRIELEHLMAALAVWEFCHKSVEYVFGDTLGDQVADTILSALKTAGSSGLSRTELSNLFSRNVPANQIARALGELSRRGLARQHKSESSSGRPAEVWSLS
jgi:phage/plasmid primase-like uncharacterized protein